MDDRDRAKRVFFSPEGHFPFKRMPFGLTNAPATYQRAMNTILNGLAWMDCLVYLDNIVIFAKKLQEHNRRMEAVLQRLEVAALKLNAKKCQLLREKTVIFGQAVSKKGVATDPKKIKALKECHITYPQFVCSWDALGTTNSSFLISSTTYLHFRTSKE